MKTRPAKERPFNVIILGDPASGKGTQSARLARMYDMYDLDMGREVKKPAALKRYDYAHTTAVGKLTPTVVVRGIFKHTIGHIPADQGIIFSGTPKMVNEAHLVEHLLREKKRRDPLVIYLTLTKAEMLRRMSGRRVIVNGRRVRRDDDNARALANRRKYYKEQIAHVVEFFKKRYEFRTISGMGSEPQVAERINTIIAKHLKNHADERN